LSWNALIIDAQVDIISAESPLGIFLLSILYELNREFTVATFRYVEKTNRFDLGLSR
jgi:hypothetical protein